MHHELAQQRTYRGDDGLRPGRGVPLGGQPHPYRHPERPPGQLWPHPRHAPHPEPAGQARYPRHLLRPRHHRRAIPRGGPGDRPLRPRDWLPRLHPRDQQRPGHRAPGHAPGGAADVCAHRPAPCGPPRPRRRPL